MVRARGYFVCVLVLTGLPARTALLTGSSALVH